ncbi:MAG TPA: hypothetical protein VMF03_08255 [Steroidobacteraceae bacterium]|nr:hypothetical protein [Steroidobacteraceae bacterium]
MKRTVGLLALLGYGCATALAQGTADPMEACSRIGDAGARLACFDQEIQKRHAATDAARVAPTPAPAAAPAPAPAARTQAPATPSPAAASRPPADDTIGLDGKQLSRKRREEGIAPAAPTLIVAGLRQLDSRPGHQYYFELDNGQVWETVDNQGQLLLGAHETVSIRSGILGSFLLKTEAGNSIRVHRIR